MDPLQMREKLYRITTWCTAIFAVLCCILCVVYFQNITFFETHGKIGTLAQQEQQALEQENSRRLLAKKNIAVTIADKPQGMLIVPLQGKVEESQVSVREEFVQNKLVITIKEAAACIKEGTELISDSAYMNGISIYQQKNDLILELYCNAMYAYRCQIDNQTLSFTFLDPAAVYEKSIVIYVPQGQKDRFTSEDWQKSIKELATQNKCKIFLCSELQEDYTEEAVVAFANRIHADSLFAIEVLENAESSQLTVLCNPAYFIPDFGSVDLGVILGEAVKTKTALPIIAVEACSGENVIVADAKVPSAKVEISLATGYLKSIETEYSFYHAVMEALETTMMQIISTQVDKSL